MDLRPPAILRKKKQRGPTFYSHPHVVHVSEVGGVAGHFQFVPLSTIYQPCGSAAPLGGVRCMPLLGALRTHDREMYIFDTLDLRRTMKPREIGEVHFHRIVIETGTAYGLV